MLRKLLVQLIGRLIENASWIFFRFFCRGKIIGINNLPEEPYVVAANHVSYFDWLVLHSFYKKILKKEIIFIAKKRLFDNGILGLLVEYAKSINVNQDKVTISFVKATVNVMNERKILGIFPEGKRTEDGKLSKGLPGVIKIAQTKNVPIVPVGLNGFFDILPKDKRIPRIRKCSIVIGDPMNFEKKPKSEIANDEIEDDLRRLMCKIAELTDQEYNY